LILTIDGTNFVPGAQALWNNSPRATQFISSTEIVAAIQSSDLARNAVIGISVRNVGSATGTSDAVPFVVSAPAPHINYIDPSVTPSRSAAPLDVTAIGTGFVRGTQFRVNDTDVPSSDFSTIAAHFTIPAQMMSVAGTLHVTAFNPDPDGRLSEQLTLTVGNPIAVLTSLTYDPVPNGYLLTAIGSNFVPDSHIIEMGPNVLTTQFVSENKLTAVLTAKSPGFLDEFWVENPAPAGGISQVLSHRF
jgi:hypothetical protein